MPLKRRVAINRAAALKLTKLYSRNATVGGIKLTIYVDTAPLIYLIEQVPHYSSLVAQRLSATDVLVVSDLSRLECRVKPLRDGNTALLDEFERFFNDSVSDVLPLSRDVVDRATEIRAHYGFKTPDAIHLAVAAMSNCDLFFTADHRLDRFAEVKVESLPS